MRHIQQFYYISKKNNTLMGDLGILFYIIEDSHQNSRKSINIKGNYVECIINNMMNG